MSRARRFLLADPPRIGLESPSNLLQISFESAWNLLQISFESIGPLLASERTGIGWDSREGAGAEQGCGPGAARARRHSHGYRSGELDHAAGFAAQSSTVPWRRRVQGFRVLGSRVSWSKPSTQDRAAQPADRWLVYQLVHFVCRAYWPALALLAAFADGLARVLTRLPLPGRPTLPRCRFETPALTKRAFHTYALVRPACRGAGQTRCTPPGYSLPALVCGGVHTLSGLDMLATLLLSFCHGTMDPPLTGICFACTLCLHTLLTHVPATSQRAIWQTASLVAG